MIDIRFKNFYIVFFFLIFFSGCATKEAVRNISDEESLRLRVTEFWNHRINLALDKCYNYEYPLMRKKINLVQYIRSFNTAVARWKDFSIRNIEFGDDESAEVNLRVRVSVKVPTVKRSARETDITEKWVKVDGTWYHVSKRFL